MTALTADSLPTARPTAQASGATHGRKCHVAFIKDLANIRITKGFNSNST